MINDTDRVIAFPGQRLPTPCTNCQLLEDQVEALRQTMEKDRQHYASQLVALIENSVKTLKTATDKIYELEKKLEEKNA